MSFVSEVEKYPSMISLSNIKSTIIQVLFLTYSTAFVQKNVNSMHNI